MMDAAPPTNVIDFQAAYDGARERRRALMADEKRRKKAQRPRRRRQPPEGLDEAELKRWQAKEDLRIEDAKTFADQRRYESELVRERMESGFRLHVGRMVGQRWREGVHEKGLRSDAFGTAGKLFVSSCPRGGVMRASWDKALLDVQAKAKVLSLDFPYIEMNKTVLQWVRIDLDKEWPSVTDFKLDMLDLVGRRLPHAPNLVAGDLLPDGRFRNPQVYFALPPKMGVWNDPQDPRCDMERVRWFKGVSLGIVDACRDLGADPNAPVLTMRGKNPLSPMWHSFSMAPESFCDLREWSVWVDSRLDREKLVRSIFGERSGLDIEGSNGFFRALQKRAADLLRRWHFDRDPRYVGKAAGEIADALHVAMEPDALEAAAATKAAGKGKRSDRQVARTVAMVAEYAAAWWNPNRLDRTVSRGQLMHVTAGMRTVRERQQAGAEYASQTKAEATLEKLVEAWDSLAVETSEPSKAALAREAKVSRTTVHARWSDLNGVLEARKGCSVRCKEIRVPTSPLQSFSTGEADQDETGRSKPAICPASCAAEQTEPPAIALPVSHDGHPAVRTAPPREAGSNPWPLTVNAVRKPEPPQALAGATVTIWPEDLWGEDDEDQRILAEQEAFLAMADGTAACDDDPPWLAAA
ncbi:MAG: hypothetical protein MEQ84_07595 [Mesorhizobium sp.]|nr:hypothetical protein [Mesorhizobium sp.]